MIVYFWDYTSNSVKCVSHTCITPDLRKRNEQVTKFIETVYQIYISKQQNAGHGLPKLLSLFSDNCGDQFKNKYHFGWGSRFLHGTKFGCYFSSTISRQDMAKEFVIQKAESQNMQLEMQLCMGPNSTMPSTSITGWLQMEVRYSPRLPMQRTVLTLVSTIIFWRGSSWTTILSTSKLIRLIVFTPLTLIGYNLPL
jgi:hypothetical protein